MQYLYFFSKHGKKEPPRSFQIMQNMKSSVLNNKIYNERKECCTMDTNEIKLACIEALIKAGLTEENMTILTREENAQRAVNLWKKNFLENDQKPIVTVSSSVLQYISDGQEIIIPPCDGREKFGQTKKVFVTVAKKLTGREVIQNDEPTDATPVAVHQLIDDATFAQMFLSKEEVLFTEMQIIEFSKVYPNWLQTGDGATFLLFKDNKEITVATIFVNPNKTLWLDYRDFYSSTIWKEKNGHRIVIPKSKNVCLTP